MLKNEIVVSYKRKCLERTMFMKRNHFFHTLLEWAFLSLLVVGIIGCDPSQDSSLKSPGNQINTATDKPPVSPDAVNPPQEQPKAVLPKLVDLGADKCIPCKKMAPILEELKETYKGKLEVVFIDVWKNPKAGQPYGIRLIPTQIFYDASGKELFRHEGFFSKEDILKKFEEFGIKLEESKKTEK